MTYWIDLSVLIFPVTELLLLEVLQTLVFEIERMQSLSHRRLFLGHRFRLYYLHLHFLYRYHYHLVEFSLPITKIHTFSEDMRTKKLIFPNWPKLKQSHLAQSIFVAMIPTQRLKLPKSILTDAQNLLATRVSESIKEYEKRVDFETSPTEDSFCLLLDSLNNWLLENVKIPEDVFQVTKHFSIPNFDVDAVKDSIFRQRKDKWEERLIVDNMINHTINYAVVLLLDQITASINSDEDGQYIIQMNDVPRHF
jgi:hypothetical protein